MKRITATATALGFLTLSACTSATDDSHTESQVAEASPQAHETQDADGDYVQTEADPPATASGAPPIRTMAPAISTLARQQLSRPGWS